MKPLEVKSYGKRMFTSEEDFAPLRVTNVEHARVGEVLVCLEGGETKHVAVYDLFVTKT